MTHAARRFAARLKGTLCGIGMLLLAAPSGASGAPVDLQSAFAQAEKTGQPLALPLELGGGLRVNARVETTNQGNGTLTLPNLSLRLFDRQDDGWVYRGDTLRLDLIPLGGRRFADLVISGIAMHTGEKETDPVREESLVFIYRLDCRSGRFKRIFSNSALDIEMAAPDRPPIACPAPRRRR